MDDPLAHAIEVIFDLSSRGGATLSEPARLALRMAIDDIDEAQKERLPDLYLSLFKGFFRAAEAGETFANPARISERFGNTLEGNYPEANATFLKFAYSFWTLKLLDGDLFSHRDTVVGTLIGQLEADVASVFFPTPGPISIPAAQREAKQREILGALCSIDVEDFIRGNPILIRDRNRASASGCMVALLTVGPALIRRAMES